LTAGTLRLSQAPRELTVGPRRVNRKEDTPVFRKPIWFVVGLVACFYAVYRWIRL
jgi:hypothetical protein